ncbi:LuxR family transcriptional regulator [Roseiflexus castenholzii]|uniref:Transcriptional regulator, LuxR family n=1 Tax=Roseiflexus castenholzii (strain DSM 13941 / HLO8) TaxID=383372 RepID=A7NI42_ROSCS|nr:response regulator transcription factor [Roseiflexus castenholzii]ABU57142.1 transcriptional regulator, LuxR family [Roseiflexus castenholzii DSM 13941]
MDHPLTLFLFDPHALATSAVRARLTAAPDLALLAVAPDLAALPDTAEPPAHAFLVLTDWRDGAPLTLASALRARWPRPAPVIWSAQSHPLRLVAALTAGAGGYVDVAAPLPDLLTVLRVAQRGGAACCAPTASQLRARLFGCPRLTDREAQVAALIAAGYANATIAATLGLTVRGVEAHVHRLCRKTGARTRVDLARWWLLRPWLCGTEGAVTEGA